MAGMIIVGAGECGARAAQALRKEGYDGPVTLIGAEPREPYERPPLSKQALTDPDPPPPKTIVTAERLRELDIDFRSGARVTAIDREAQSVALHDGGRLTYDRLLLATGAHPRRLRLEGAEHRAVAYLRSFDDALRLRADMAPGRTVVVIGGGFIGLEVAASARQRGASVTVVEVLPRLLSRVVPAEIAAVVEGKHRQEGVDIACSSGVSGFADAGERVAVKLAGGDTIMADLVVVGIGVVPETALAAACGLEVDNGIVTDDRLRTSDPAIYAAGDCASFEMPIYGDRAVRLESWRGAIDLGNHAAGNMLGADEPVGIVPWFWSDQYDLTLQIAGLPDEGAETVRREDGDGRLMLFHLARDGRLVAASGIGQGNAVAKDIRVAEMLVAKGARPDRAALASAATKLKTLLAA